MREPLKWSEMFPNGRILFYEGKDPEGFRQEMRDKHGFDPASPFSFVEGVAETSHWNKRCGYSFVCPSNVIDHIYNGQYPLGS